MKRKNISLTLSALLLTGLFHQACTTESLTDDFSNGNTLVDTVFLAGNSFITASSSGSTAVIESEGVKQWSDPATVISTYLRVDRADELRIALPNQILATDASSTISIQVNDGDKKTIDLQGNQSGPYELGTFSVDEGYVKIDLQGVDRSAENFGQIPALLISGTHTETSLLYSDQKDFFYWARRGPSCHLAYTVPTDESIRYYYNEINVPVGEDPVGSYFMANGFGEGYFGIQVNSEDERRILFSVWSPHETDDPGSIPEDKRITLNKKGEQVYVGEFGNEGSGGQSYLVYPWEAGKTYQFLLKGEPDGNGKTNYTAWFHAPDESQWKLIASFKRPETDTYLTGFHSFLENFNPNQGYLGRKANYLNQWVHTASGEWLKVTEANFTVDATYAEQQRIDAIGGVADNGYFLRNGGFFSELLEPGTALQAENAGTQPQVHFDTLP